MLDFLDYNVNRSVFIINLSVEVIFVYLFHAKLHLCFYWHSSTLQYRLFLYIVSYSNFICVKVYKLRLKLLSSSNQTSYKVSR